EGGPSLLRISRLSVDPGADGHDRVDPQDWVVSVAPLHRERLAPGVLGGHIVGPAFEELLYVRGDGREADPQLREDRPPLRRARGEDQGRAFRRAQGRTAPLRAPPTQASRSR